MRGKETEFWKSILRTVLLCSFFMLLMGATCAIAAVPQIASIANDTASQGTTYSKTPALAAGASVTWTKEFGPDDMTVDPSSGAVSWAIPSTLPRESFHLGVRATNSDGYTTTTWVLTVGGGTVRYVNGTTGNDSTGTGSLAAPYKTISKGNSVAASGDTIIVQDGTYTGIANMMADMVAPNVIPPNGTSSAYTTIMSEHPGGAFVDGQSLYNPISWHGNYTARVSDTTVTYATQYIALKGFLFAHAKSDAVNGTSNGSVIFMNHVNNIKIIDCGAYDQQIDDSGSVINVSRSNYILIEGSYAYGNGRECITEYVCDHVVTRRNVCRLDRANYADPFAGIVNYGNAYAVNQNNIVIDMDQWGHYGYQNSAGALDDSIGGLRGNSSPVNSVQVFSHNSIALNVYNSFLVNVEQNENGGTGSDPTIMDNIVGWDMKAIPGYTSVGDTSPYSILTIPGNTQLNQMTFGKFSSPLSTTAYTCFFNGWDMNQSLTNSIIDGVSEYGGTNNGNIFYGFETADYNNIFNTGTINYNGTTATNTIATDPTTSCLKYLPRIEAGCSLQSAGASGARVGANVTTMRGKSGTMWGETGYDTDSSYPMWPFPHEDLIKAKMQAYSYSDSESTNPWVNGPAGTGYIPSGVHTTGLVTGDRGFASSTAKQLNGQPVTLTSYIWEYLGNPIPADIYGITSTPVTTPTITAPTIAGSPVTNATVGVAYSFTPTASNASSFNIIGSLPPGLTFNTVTGSLSGIPNAVGTYSNIQIVATNITGSTFLPAFSITIASSGKAGGVNVSVGSGSSGTPVPVMEGWWLFPGMLAGVGIFARRRKE